MEKQSIAAPSDALLDRVYIVAATLSAFKGRRHVEVHIFRHGATEEELAALQGKKLVGPPDPAVPPQVLQGATKEAACAAFWKPLLKRKAGPWWTTSNSALCRAH